MEYEKLIARIDELVSEGKTVLNSKYDRHDGGGLVSRGLLKEELFYKWKINSLSYLQKVFGDGSLHFKEFQAVCKSANYHEANRGQAILLAAKVDIEGGHLKKLEDLVIADIFDDFLEMAKYLLEQGYKDPAASLIGAVLEDGLRKIATNRNIILVDNDNMNSLNQKIYKAQIYNKLVFKNVQVWNEIRNNADHAKFNEYSNKDVESMLNGVSGFMSQYL